MIQSRDFIAALEKGLQVIEAFDRATTRLTLSDLAARVGITRAAARRYLLTLTELGYAEQDGRHFSLTPKVLRLGHAHLAGNPVLRIAQPVLDEISARTLESASAGVLAGAEVVFVARAPSPRPISVHVAFGTQVPAFCTAMGRMLLADLPGHELRHLLELSPPQPLSARTRTAVDEIVAEVDRARAADYAVSEEELELGLMALAVPVRNSLGRAMLSLGLSVPAGRMTRDQMVDTLLPVLREGASRIGGML